MLSFSSSRSALYHILITNFEKFKSKKILIPDYTCHTVVDSIKKSKLNYEYYEIDEKFHPNFQDINLKISSGDFFGLLGTNYFGFPYFLDEFINISKKFNIFFFEDNSHGLGGVYKEKKLGEFGDFGFTSLSKHLRIQSGGNLFIKSHLNQKILENSYNFLDKEKIDILFILRYLINKGLPNLSSKLSSYKNKNIILDNPFLYRDNYFSHTKIDDLSKRLFKRINISKLKEKNNFSYKYWQNLLSYKFNISPIFDIDLDVNPWCISYIIHDNNEKNELISYLRSHNAVCFSWPTLPKDLIVTNSNALNLWKKILCISTSHK